MTDPVHQEDHNERTEVLEGTTVRVISFKLGDRYSAQVDNIDPGAVIGRARASTRAEAEGQALDAARVPLAFLAARNRLKAARGSG